MIFFMFFIFIAYLLFPILGYFQFKSENSKIIEEQRISFSIKDMMRSKSNQESLKLMKWGIWAGVSAFLSILLMGIPGALFIGLYELFNVVPAKKLEGDMMWPLALLISLYVPIAWPLALSVNIMFKRYWNLQYKHTVKIVILIWLLLPILWIRFLI